MGKMIRQGMLWVFLGLFPASLIVAIFYRFPVPFRGYIRGWDLFSEGPNTSIELIWLILQSVFFYTLWGGFIAIAMLGTLSGVLGWRLGKSDRAGRYTRNIALGLAFGAAGVLSVLDKIIGKW